MINPQRSTGCTRSISANRCIGVVWLTALISSALYNMCLSGRGSKGPYCMILNRGSYEYIKVRSLTYHCMLCLHVYLRWHLIASYVWKGMYWQSCLSILCINIVINEIDDKINSNPANLSFVWGVGGGGGLLVLILVGMLWARAKWDPKRSRGHPTKIRGQKDQNPRKITGQQDQHPTKITGQKDQHPTKITGQKYQKSYENNGSKRSKSYENNGSKRSKSYENNGSKRSKSYENNGSKRSKSYENKEPKISKSYENKEPKISKSYENKEPKRSKSYENKEPKRS